jgi:hypothetical protein
MIVKKALLGNHLLLLNFDDYTYPEELIKEITAKGAHNEHLPSAIQTIGHDPNLKEFSGTKAFPNQLWSPNDVCKNRELLE